MINIQHIENMNQVNYFALTEGLKNNDYRIIMVKRKNKKGGIKELFSTQKPFLLYPNKIADKDLPYTTPGDDKFTLSKKGSLFQDSINSSNRVKNLDELPYACYVDSYYRVKNDLELWEKLIEAELFDLWDPKYGPYKMLAGKTNYSDGYLLILRAFKLEIPILKNQISGHRKKKLINLSHQTNSTALMDNEEFDQLKSKIQSVIQPYLANGQNIIDLPGKQMEAKQPLFSMLSIFFQSKGFHFTNHQIATFYTALKTKGFVILSGLSGTGKTKIAQLFAELINGKDKKKNCYLAVRPDWRDSKSLLGYYNPLDNKYCSTNFTDTLLEAGKRWENGDKDISFNILDEMNLARVEHYFSDFLSVLESGRDEKDNLTREDLKLHDSDEKEIPTSIKLPPNLYFVGTVNVDETTHMFSPKVLDRAFTIEFNEVDFDKYIDSAKANISEKQLTELKESILKDLSNDGKFTFINKQAIKDFANGDGKKYKIALIDLKDKLEPHELHFAYRIFDEIMMFLINAEDSFILDGFRGNDTDERLNDAFDSAVLMKVLPKFHGPTGRMEKPLKEVIKWCLRDGSMTEESFSKSDHISLIIESLTEQLKGTGGDEEVTLNIDDKIIAVNYPRTALKAFRMLKKLSQTGYTSFS